MKIYIACGLTHVNRDVFARYCDHIHYIAELLRGIEAVSSVKYALLNSDPQLADYSEDKKAKLCYQWDREMVLEAGLVVAEASFPST